MDQEKVNSENPEKAEPAKLESETPKQGFIRIKKFHFTMLLFLIAFLTAGITTFALAFGNDEQPAVKVIREREEFQKLYEAYDTLRADYYTKVDEKKLINGAINGMVDSLEDPYSDYMSQDDAKNFHQNISSSFEGIGAEIQEKDGHIVIVTPIKGSPAQKAGLKPEDKVLTVDGKPLQGMSSSEAVALIRGEKGTKVKLSILRPGTEQPMDVSIVRDTIPIETVYGEMLEDDIAKVQITNFSEHTAKELTGVLADLEKKGMKGLVLDLRQNPGGLLDQAIDISSMFVPSGKVLFKVEDRNGNVQEFASKGKGNPEMPLVVVIDKGSASASEILAGAVSESAGVPLVGEKSFGKGTVQRAEGFKDGSNLKFTTEKWLTPKGNWIHKKGIKPNYEVALPEYASLPFINPDAELKVSSASEQVKAAQKMLSVLGYDPGRDDGFFDENTKQAVIRFQQDKSLEQTGILSGNSTIELMTALKDKIEKEDPQIKQAQEILKKEMKQ
ncbi:S41 family peptidase [Mesobacillus zeae]|uniref:PDZ domain-containing protein n=1 Tax=Mesobacillus zeae TaxID=1917180 RepID=A0A398B6N8_9BACI|nr:S41 family peptidase [Mesobacillus zeae]RID85512.1 PDZ domain-containing protein [Mesobacillus zeae]